MTGARRRIDWGAVGLFALGLVSTGLAVTGLSPTVGAVAGAAPLVEFRPSSLVPAPLAVSLFALAAIALVPRTGERSGAPPPREDRAFWRAATRLFYVAGAGVVTAVVAAPLGQAALGAMLAGRGYERCPPSDAERRPPLRWHAPGGACP